MNPKDAVDIFQLLHAVNDNIFDGGTIKSLYISLRQHVAKDSITRELGDFFAHSERDRGPILRTLRFLKPSQNNKEGKTVIRMGLVMPTKASYFIDDLVEELEKIQLDTSHIVSRSLEIQLCIFSLLDNCRINYDNTFAVLKLSSNLHKNKDNKRLFSIALLKPGSWGNLLYMSEIFVDDYLEADTKDFDLSYHYRVRRIGEQLRIDTIIVEPVDGGNG